MAAKISRVIIIGLLIQKIEFKHLDKIRLYIYGVLAVTKKNCWKLFSKQLTRIFRCRNWCVRDFTETSL